MKAVSFKKGIEALGYSIEKYSKGYNYRSAFALDSEDKLWYFNIEDLRDAEPRIMRRTAKSLTDYTGGVNMWDVKEQLEELGLKIVEKRSKGDYNNA